MSKRTCIPQHEFIHLLTMHADDENGISIAFPGMSQDEHQHYLKLQSALKQTFKKEDSHFFGKLRTLLTGRTKTGINGYAFFSDKEFATVSVDTFMKQPKELCKTQAGKQLYALYRHYFKLDPLKQFKDLA